jgi:hypothetical protein
LFPLPLLLDCAGSVVSLYSTVSESVDAGASSNIDSGLSLSISPDIKVASVDQGSAESRSLKKDKIQLIFYKEPTK